MAKAVQYWLMKSEPGAFSIDDLANETNQTTFWDGVRNYQARNFMRSMKVGDRVLFYHSNSDPPAVAGTAVVTCEAYPDFTARDRNNKHYDPKATSENPIWEMVDIKLDTIFPELLSLKQLKETASLEGMELLRRGSRLSVQPVSKQHFHVVLKLARQAAAGGSSTKKKKS